ncbi:putative pre-rRNA-processing protein [Gregarina niphandrodes]|uniref:Pre-rRNA-processing protein n=1 Tax=Gregarina niphandrodes TaxID=110365 RepID=A0A023AYL2_GRENI|nr:putative pre-rRNA-processing protein [Gregarina niphandrodes]EZG43756.1 putative pre-rRNA-processing protein [Gregarina niphandrodes]|eukprot:XP_011134627.1 putative pre-rRNA-processing protein [Gregarina niphandrodes]
MGKEELPGNSEPGAAQQPQFTPEELKGEVTEKAKSTGVIYLSSVPAGIKPWQVETLLSSMGDIGRVFLRPNEKKPGLYRDGWVEFLNKKNAKVCAELLNTQPINDKKLSGALWNIRYLHRFKWQDLVGYRFMEAFTKKKRLESEISSRNRSTQDYIERVVMKKEGKKRALRARKRREDQRALKNGAE